MSSSTKLSINQPATPLKPHNMSKASTVEVKNIATSTADGEIKDFFSFW